jgi:glycosyltransferase involved in cell wall biosynthesis
MPPKISVLVPTYNRARFLPQCLQSLFAQSLPPFEVIVVDDGSTDETPELLRSYGERVRALRKPNGGKSTALNMGLEAVKGDYVWVLDDDDVALPFALERMVAPLLEDPAFGLSFAGCVKKKGCPDGGFEQQGTERILPKFADCDLFLTLLQRGQFLETSAAVLVRSSVYRQVGPFDTCLVRSQDYDMLLRLSRAFPAARVAGPMYIFRQHDGQRGSKQDLFNAEERFRKWRAYDKIILRKVREDTPLQDYLSRDGRSATLSPADQRQAYLLRAGVMARGGLFREMLEDLRFAFAIDRERPLCAQELEALNEVDHHLLLEEEELWDSGFIRELREACGSRAGEDVSKLLARRIYWYARENFRRRRLGAALRASQSLVQLLGARGIARAWRP